MSQSSSMSSSDDIAPFDDLVSPPAVFDASVEPRAAGTGSTARARPAAGGGSTPTLADLLQQAHPDLHLDSSPAPVPPSDGTRGFARPSGAVGRSRVSHVSLQSPLLEPEPARPFGASVSNNNDDDDDDYNDDAAFQDGDWDVLPLDDLDAAAAADNGAEDDGEDFLTALLAKRQSVILNEAEPTLQQQQDDSTFKSFTAKRRSFGSFGGGTSFTQSHSRRNSTARSRSAASRGSVTSVRSSVCGGDDADEFDDTNMQEMIHAARLAGVSNAESTTRELLGDLEDVGFRAWTTFSVMVALPEDTERGRLVARWAKESAENVAMQRGAVLRDEAARRLRLRQLRTDEVFEAAFRHAIASEALHRGELLRDESAAVEALSSERRALVSSCVSRAELLAVEDDETAARCNLVHVAAHAAISLRLARVELDAVKGSYSLARTRRIVGATIALDFIRPAEQLHRTEIHMAAAADRDALEQAGSNAKVRLLLAAGVDVALRQIANTDEPRRRADVSKQQQDERVKLIRANMAELHIATLKTQQRILSVVTDAEAAARAEGEQEENMCRAALLQLEERSANVLVEMVALCDADEPAMRDLVADAEQADRDTLRAFHTTVTDEASERCCAAAAEAAARDKMYHAEDMARRLSALDGERRERFLRAVDDLAKAEATQRRFIVNAYDADVDAIAMKEARRLGKNTGSSSRRASARPPSGAASRAVAAVRDASPGGAPSPPSHPMPAGTARGKIDRMFLDLACVDDAFAKSTASEASPPRSPRPPVGSPRKERKTDAGAVSFNGGVGGRKGSTVGSGVTPGRKGSMANSFNASNDRMAASSEALPRPSGGEAQRRNSKAAGKTRSKRTGSTIVAFSEPDILTRSTTLAPSSPASHNASVRRSSSSKAQVHHGFNSFTKAPRAPAEEPQGKPTPRRARHTTDANTDDALFDKAGDKLRMYQLGDAASPARKPGPPQPSPPSQRRTSTVTGASPRDANLRKGSFSARRPSHVNA